MKILLCQDIEKLGWFGDVVEVAEGYARNYLLPQGLAKVPSEANIRSLAEEKSGRIEQRKLARQQLEKAVSDVEGAEAVIAAKANEQGHLFGSVSRHDIAENLRQQGFEITDDMIQFAEHHIKQVGTHDITIKATADLTATAKGVVVAQGGANESEDTNQEAQVSGE